MTTARRDDLERAVYGLGQVDRLLQLKTGTAERWIDGYVRGTKSYKPVIRPERTGRSLVTWGEFVECAFLAQYRSQGVPLLHLRPVVQILRERLGVRYPLAHARLFVQGKDLVEQVQMEARLEPSLAIVVRTGQVLADLNRKPTTVGLQLSAPAQAFVDQVGWQGSAEDEVVVRLHPLGKASPVVIDPGRSFGEPTVRGIRTDVLAEEVRAGEPVEFVARSFGLNAPDVEAAVEFERAA